ncbi:MAG: hypothetical protein LBM75_06200, partial [Myxococcales bacterium]|nr:hypothetical protein [Myxococcales bacterium]
ETYGEITYSHIPARLAFGTPPEGVSWNSNMTVNGMTLPREDGPISAGAKVLVSVNPDDNTITGWTGITCDHLSQDKTSCLFTMPSSPVTINVTVKQKYLLTVTSPPPEGVTWNTNMTINGVTKPLQNDQIEGGAQVILGVTPGNNTIEWILTGGATCDVSLLNLSNNTLCLFEMPSANTNARVNATPNNYTLTTSALPEVGTSVQCSTDADDPCNAARGGCAPTYSKNTKVCVHFDPPSSYEFAGVAYLTCPGTRTVSETVQRCELTMDSNKTVSIIFTQKPNITAMKLPVDPTNDGILASSLGSLPAAEYLPSTTLVGFTASNGDDYEFLTSNNSYTCATQAWTGSSSPYSCDVTVNGPTSYYVYAIFTRKPVLTIAMVGEHAELGYSAESCPAPIEELDAGDMQSPGAPMPVDSGSSHCVQVTIDPGWSLEATGCLGGVWQEISANIYQCRVDSISSNTTVTATISREPAVENTLNIGSITNGVLSACPASVEADDNAVTSGPHNYLTDTTVSICATASNTGAAPIGGAGCPGTGWNAEGDDVYSCVVTMDVDQIVFAIFASELAPDAGEEEPDAGGEDPGEDAGEEEPDAGGEDPGEDAGEEEPDAGGEDPGEDAGEEEPDAGGEDPGEDAGEEELDAGEEDPGEEDPEIE